MSYHVVDPENLSADPDHPCDRRSVAEAVGLSNIAAAAYELIPGEDLATTYHSHAQREELFVVVEGTLAVETPERTYRVDAGEVFVVEPDNPIRPYNPPDAAGIVRVFGVGAPAFDPGIPYDPENAT